MYMPRYIIKERRVAAGSVLIVFQVENINNFVYQQLRYLATNSAENGFCTKKSIKIGKFCSSKKMLEIPGFS